MFFLKIICLLAVQTLGFSYSHAWTKMTERSLQENMHRLSPTSLNRYGKCVYSQFGEDGIIEEIFRRLNIKEGFFVEFGAADGIFISNTRYLWEKGWSGVMIEAKKNLFAQLSTNYSGDSRVLPLNHFITWKEQDHRGMLFDAIKEQHFPNQEIDFLSIDIDGGDYYILKTLKCRPKVICIENNLNWHPLFNQEIPEKIALKNIHQPLQVIIDAARDLGYEPVCLTINLFLVRKDLYAPFAKIPSDTMVLWRDAFRAFPDKCRLVNFRKVSSTIKEIEGNYYESICPIAENF